MGEGKKSAGNAEPNNAESKNIDALEPFCYA